MLTVLVKETLSHRQIIYAVERVEWRPAYDESPAVLVLVKAENGANDIRLECTKNSVSRMVYVMNHAGQTIATYPLFSSEKPAVRNDGPMVVLKEIARVKAEKSED